MKTNAPIILAGLGLIVLGTYLLAGPAIAGAVAILLGILSLVANA